MNLTHNSNHKLTASRTIIHQNNNNCKLTVFCTIIHQDNDICKLTVFCTIIHLNYDNHKFSVIWVRIYWDDGIHKFLTSWVRIHLNYDNCKFSMIWVRIHQNNDIHKLLTSWVRIHLNHDNQKFTETRVRIHLSHDNHKFKVSQVIIHLNTYHVTLNFLSLHIKKTLVLLCCLRSMFLSWVSAVSQALIWHHVCLWNQSQSKVILYIWGTEMWVTCFAYCSKHNLMSLDRLVTCVLIRKRSVMSKNPASIVLSSERPVHMISMFFYGLFWLNWLSDILECCKAQHDRFTTTPQAFSADNTEFTTTPWA